jgi:ubiquinone/menaquinone biosynthesis C-methylase UbiE
MEKEERAKRWSKGEGYDRYIKSELASFRKEAWKRQICAHFDEGSSLKVLDVGTGPGFFACILSEEGHMVTGIDSSEGMLACARENAEKLGVQPTFLHMDLNAMSFEDESFDVLIMRNVTWTLEFPEQVYTEFKRVLKPGGMLIIYDANWHIHFFVPELLEKVRARERRYFEKYGRREIVSSGDMEYYKTAPLTHTRRPEWDRRVLENLGFAVSIEEDVGRKVYDEWEKELYGESPLFEICAVKQAEKPTVDKMHTYWQGRASSWGSDYSKAQLEEISTQIRKYLPEGKQAVLDVGTGPGAVAASMALLGQEVTGIDLCSNMIRRARAAAERLELPIRYLVTEAGELPFADDSFDIIISRNLTWALPEPEETFRQWQRVLKPGGLLIYWDGNHYLYQYDEQAYRDRELVFQKIGTVHGGERFDPTLCDNAARELPLSKLSRPENWDEIILPRLRFDIVAEEVHRPQRLLRYGIYDRGFYTHFLIVAKNGKGLPA